jgi:hypothetical protein
MTRVVTDGAYMASVNTLYAFNEPYDTSKLKKVTFLEEFFELLWNTYGYRPFDANEAGKVIISQGYNTQDVIRMLRHAVERGILEKRNIRDEN